MTRSITYIQIFFLIHLQLFDHVKSEYCGVPTHLLANWFIPTNYDIELDINLTENRFSGSNRISLNRLVDNRSIVLHVGPNLSIKEVQVFGTTNQAEEVDLFEQDLIQIPVIKVCHDEKYELLVIDIYSARDNLTKLPKILVNLSYEGFTPAGHTSLIRLYYEGNNINYLAPHIIYTKFGRFGAHYLIPCLNETRFNPTIKLSFNRVPDNYLIVSFTSVLKQRVISVNNNRYEFGNSQGVSMDQFGFVMSNFLEYPEQLDSEYANEKQSMLIFRPIGSDKLSQFAQDMISLSFHSVKSLLSSRYARKALKIFLVPCIESEHEVNMASVMIVNYDWMNRDLSESDDFDETTYHVVKMVEHMARQWFGYLIRLERDNDSWLFDGFVGWTSLQLTDAILAQLVKRIRTTTISYKLLFYRNQLARALSEDDLQNDTIAIEFIYNKSKEFQINEKSISWNRENHHLNEFTFSKSLKGDFKLNEMQRIKSIAIVNLLDESCGDRFRNAIDGIFTLYRFKSITFEEIFHKLTLKCQWKRGFSLEKYLTKAGYPLIKATYPNESPLQLSLSKTKFIADSTDLISAIQESSLSQQEPELSHAWSQTISYKYGDNKQSFVPPPFQMLSDQANIRPAIMNIYFQMGGPFYWLKINTSNLGYYRVLYSDPMIRAFRIGGQSQLNHLDSMNLLSDALAIVKSGIRGSYYLVEILKIAAPKSNEILKHMVIEAFTELRTIYQGYPRYTKEIQNFGIKLFIEEYSRYRFTINGLLTKQGREARAKIYEFMARSDYGPLIMECLAIYRSPQLGQVHKDLHLAMFIAIARYGTDKEISDLLAMQKEVTERSVELDRKIFIALAQSRQIDRLKIAWDHVRKYKNLDILVDFVKNLFNVREGTIFANTQVLPRLALMHPELGHDVYLKLIKDICNIINNPLICSKEAEFIRIIQDESSIDDLNQFLTDQRMRQMLLQQLDVNKLVFL